MACLCWGFCCSFKAFQIKSKLSFTCVVVVVYQQMLLFSHISQIREILLVAGASIKSISAFPLLASTYFCRKNMTML